MIVGRRAGLRAPALAVALIACDAAAPAPAPAAARGTWTLAAPMNEPRAWHSATALEDGRVLAAGGRGTFDAEGNGTALATAEVYDPVTGAWTPTGAMHVPRMAHAAILLAGGQVLVAGGFGEFRRSVISGVDGSWGVPIPDAEVWDPSTGAWTQTPPMHHRRFAGVGATGYGAALLGDGTVLVAGAVDDPYPTAGAAAEIFDPATATWTEIQPMRTARWTPSLVRMADGRVLVVGGESTFLVATRAAEIYDPATGAWWPAAPAPRPLAGATATALPTREILLTSFCGDCLVPCGTPPAPHGWLYDPASDAWRETGEMTYPREWSSAVRLPSGNVLVAGGNWIRFEAGVPDSYAAPAADVYDPWRDGWTPTPVMPHYVLGHGAAAPLPSGAVLYTGGHEFDGLGWENVNLHGISAVQLFRE